MRVRFWGTRGSIPKPGPGTVRYGGNTSCVEVRSTDGTLVILDCGTGAHALGQVLATAPSQGHLLISHTHWDHIQGIPFFAPFFAAGNEWDIYAPRGLGQPLRDTLAGQMQYAYFPVSLEHLGATIRFHELVEGAFTTGGIRVTARYLNHPALTLGYRLEADGVTLVYATDHEPHGREPVAPEPAGTRQGSGEDADGALADPDDRRHATFLTGADLVIHDAQYAAAEYADKVGWGHSPMEYVIDLAVAAHVRRLALFHHDPSRDDDALDRLVQIGRQRVAAAGVPVELFAAAEGQVLDLRGDLARVAASTPVHDALDPGPCSPALPPTVAVGTADTGTLEVLREAICGDGLRLLTASDGESALRLARTERPALLILDRRLPGRDALDVCGALRSDRDPHTRDMPVMLIVPAEEPSEAKDGVALSVTDRLVTPFSSEYARTKVHAWLLRTRERWVRAAVPADETARLAALRRLGLLDTPPEARFDRLTRLAVRLFDVPVAAVSLVDAERLWFKSCQGLTIRETSRDVAFCAHTILDARPMVVPDALLDPRFGDNPLVTGQPHVRFYAGYPVSTADGSRVGTLCLIDHRPRQLDASQLEALRDLALLVEKELAAGEPRAAGFSA